MSSYKLYRNTISYDLTKRTISRKPTLSNLKERGSDNSLYFGLETTPIVKSTLKALMNSTNLNSISGTRYSMDFYGYNILVEFNINAQGQIQLRLGSYGKRVHYYITEYELKFNKKVNRENLQIEVDFTSNKVNLR